MNQPLPVERARELMGIYGNLKQLGNIPSPAQMASFASASTTLAQVQSKAGKTGFRPPQWGKGVVSEDIIYMATQMSDGSMMYYFFDAVMGTDHTEERQITDHPVQWGQAITDHSFQLPAVVTMEIGMSDVMDSYVLNSGSYMDYQPLSGKGKSVNAYRAFVDLEKSGQPVVLNTRLQKYSNMLIKVINARDDKSTTHSLKCTISFKEVKIGKTGRVSKSLYPPDSTPEGRRSANAAAADEKTKRKSLFYVVKESL